MSDLDLHGLVLRAAHESDAGSVADVYLSSRRAFLGFAPLAHSDEEVRQWIAGQLVAAGDVTVACRGDAIVGMLAVSHEAGIDWIDQLYVRPEHVGQGVGARLLEHALSHLDAVINVPAIRHRPISVVEYRIGANCCSYISSSGLRRDRELISLPSPDVLIASAVALIWLLLTRSE